MLDGRMEGGVNKDSNQVSEWKENWKKGVRLWKGKEKNNNKDVEFKRE